jgi:rhodanese-related sulfurtransferase
MPSTISREELKSKIDRHDNFILLEALPEEAYQLAHLPGAINLPFDEVSSRAAEVLPDKSAEIVVYCASPT